MSEMTLKTEGDKHVVVTRRFAAASPEAVYRAHTEPRLIQKWLLGPDGWTMPVCVSEARPGGKIRYEWTDGKGGGFHLLHCSSSYQSDRQRFPVRYQEVRPNPSIDPNTDLWP
jgi:uncharacterized protein YndB with AHSA1/START domain